jgi:hypothetical protein
VGARLFLWLSLVLVMLAAETASAAAARSYADQIAGVEVAATSTQGTFVGVASGALPGAWNAVVVHGPLPTTVGATAAISTGTFQLATVIGGTPETVDGSVDANSTGITMLNAGVGCTNQKFQISDTLSGVGPGGGTGSGVVLAQLVHHRTVIFGHCVTYAATIGGTITLNF